MDVIFEAIAAFFTSRAPFGWKVVAVLLMCIMALGMILIATR